MNKQTSIQGSTGSQAAIELPHTNSLSDKCMERHPVRAIAEKFRILLAVRTTECAADNFPTIHARTHL